MAGNQAYIFMAFSIVGVTIGILFDFFRIIRKTIKTNDFFTYIEDILFWILTGIIIIFSMYYFCDGELRFFMVIGIVLGAIIYLLTISRYVIKISIFFINIIKKIIINPIYAIIRFFKKKILRHIFIICINFRKNFIRILKKYKKNRGILKKREKYNSI